MTKETAVQLTTRADAWEKRHLFLYILLFFLCWTLYVVIGGPFLRMRYPVLTPFLQFKLLLWTLPVFLYLRREKTDTLAYLKLKGNLKSGVIWALVFASIFIIYQIAGAAAVAKLAGHKMGFNLHFALNKWIDGVILVGFTEEVLFRGFFLQKMMRFLNFWAANGIISVLFLMIHFPGWYMQYVRLTQMGRGMPPFVAVTFIFVFVFSMVQGYILRKSDSLWACMAVHSASNLLAYALNNG